MLAFRYRIYPNNEQKAKLESTLTTCRHLYNSALDERIREYRENGKSVSYVDQANALRGNKNKYQEQVHSQVLQDTLRRLEKSFRRFFDMRKQGKKCGFPRFKSERRFRSFCYPQSGFKLSQDQKKITLSKIGSINIRYHREVIGTIKTCTVVKDIDHWYVILTTDWEKSLRCDNPEEMIGIDVGIEKFAVLSNGQRIENPRYLKKSERKLAKLQRRLSKKQKGSNNRNKQRVKVARCHRKIRNQRNDFLHKTSYYLATTYGTIVFEKLNIKGMVKNHKLAKHISDCSWNQFINLTDYKAANANGQVILVNARNTSQICSNCGCVVPKDLSMRVHQCSHCGFVTDRDHNAALNIRTLGTRGSYASGDNVRLTSDEKSLVVSGCR